MKDRLGIIIKKEDPDIEWASAHIVMHCNREEDHPKVGKHWYKTKYYKVEWEIKGDEIWMA